MAFLEVNNLKVYYPVRGGFFKRVIGYVKAVDGISISLEQGKTYGLVGESGCGKSTTGKALLKLIKATSGEIIFNGTDLVRTSGHKMHVLRKDIQMIFQDPYSSLNPRKRIVDIITEPIRNYNKLSRNEERKIAQEYLERVGLNADSIYKYPHEFSGGQRQRIGIARALTLNPKLIIADEPVSALDVSVQAQVLNFMKDIQEDFNLTYLFISHDLGVIKHMCDRIGIMYRGRLVEEGVSQDIYEHPQHIYTKRLISAIPNIDPIHRDEQAAFRHQVSNEYDKSYADYFDKEGKAYELKQISPTHFVAMP